MTTAQKIIKYLATAFAVFLIVSIISGVLSVFYALSAVLGLKKTENKVNEEKTMINFEVSNEATTLDIEVNFTNLIIEKGDYLRVETNNENIEYKQDNQKLRIKEKAINWFAKNDEGDLIVYIPENLKFEQVKINAGAGKIHIENLNTEKLNLELGAGETEIESLTVTDNCKINSGAGKVSIASGKINDLKLDMGIGKFEISAEITGNSKVDAGIGNLNLDIKGNRKDYTIKANKGIGNIKIDKKEISEDAVYGSGENAIKIEGGIGNIDVNFSEEEI